MGNEPIASHHFLSDSGKPKKELTIAQESSISLGYQFADSGERCDKYEVGGRVEYQTEGDTEYEEGTDATTEQRQSLKRNLKKVTGVYLDDIIFFVLFINMRVRESVFKCRESRLESKMSRVKGNLKNVLK